MPASSLTLGIRANGRQFALQLIQVFFVGLTLGMTRTVVPVVAEDEFGLPRDAVSLLVAFVIAFGVVKAVMNLVAGRLSERLGRKRVLVIGWLIALPIPLMIRFGPAWGWIIAATMLLGVNQGLTWSMALTSKLDLAGPRQRGLVNGLNEFCGYFAVAVAGVITAHLAAMWGGRVGLFVFGLSVIVPAGALAVLFVKDTRPWALAESSMSILPAIELEPFKRAPRDSRFLAICQAGLVEKFTDTLVWIFVPLALAAQQVDLKHIGWVPFAYATTWGVSQLLTGPLSDRVGRRFPIAAGMFLCAASVGIMPLINDIRWWAVAAGGAGLGMALLYPTLGAAVSDIAPPTRRGAAMGAYRFWRDLGYGFGALGLGLTGKLTGGLEAGFWFVAASMALSACVFLLIGGETLDRSSVAYPPRRMH